jgi:hypothetical protein
MQTTLRLQDRVYRAAKAEAARQGVSLTRYIEDALAHRLQSPRPASGGHTFPVYRSGRPWRLSPAELTRLSHEAQTAHDEAKLRLR